MARVEKYGVLWPEGLLPCQMELGAWANYSRIQTPELPRWQHLKNAIIMMDPEMRSGWNDWTEMMCWAYGTYSYVAAMGCTTSTKTHTMHKLGAYDYSSSPKNTIMTCTTTDSKGVDTRMWPIISSTYDHWKKTGMISDWKKTVAPYKLIRSSEGDTKHVIKAQVIDPRSDKQAIVDQLIGAHAKRRIWLVDEATSAPSAILDAWGNAAAATDHRRLVMMGNPHDYADSLSSFCRPIAGWDSVDEEVETWEFEFANEKGIGLHFHGKKSPNILKGLTEKGKERWPFLFGQADLDRLESNKERSPIEFYRMCVGWFMPEGISKRVCSMAAIDRYKCKEHAVFRGGDVKFFMSLDPAFGGDRCTLMIWKKGYDVVKNKVVMDLVIRYEVPVDPRGLAGEQIGKFVQQKGREHSCDTIAVDTTTNNSSVAEWLDKNTDLKIYWITFGGSASDDRVVSPQDDRLAKDAYYNKAAELAFSVSTHLDSIHGLDPEVCNELVSRYWVPIGDKPTRMKVETKAEYKDRMKKSCDLNDCVALGVEAFRRLGGLNHSKSSGRGKNWSAIAKKRNSIWASDKAYSS